MPLGGVTVQNQVAFSTKAEGECPAYEFPAGPLRLDDGTMALRYGRERKSFEDGDCQRVRSQQAFLRGVVAGIVSRDTLSNPMKVQELAASLGGYAVTDSGLDLGTAAGIASSMTGLRSEERAATRSSTSTTPRCRRSATHGSLTSSRATSRWSRGPRSALAAGRGPRHAAREQPGAQGEDDDGHHEAAEDRLARAVDEQRLPVGGEPEVRGAQRERRHERERDAVVHPDDELDGAGDGRLGR